MEQFEQSELSLPSISISEILYLLRSWAWLIALTGILAGMVTYIVSIRTVPLYQATTTLLVSDPPATLNLNYTSMVSAQTMAPTYARMLVDRPVLQGVIDELKMQTTPDELKKSITVNMVTNTQLLVVSVLDPNGTQAANIANTIATVFGSRIRELQSQRYSSSREGLAQQVSDMEQQIATTNNAIANTTDPLLQQQLQARLTQYRTIYSNLVTNYEQVALAEEQTSTNVVVSEPATVSYTPVSPKTARNSLLAILAGMALAAGAVFAIDALDDTIKDPDEIRKRFNLPILGMITLHQAGGDKPITVAQPRSPVAESFRSLRTNITFAAVDQPLRRIMITSPTPQDGKTTVSSNLAVVLSQGEKKVVLIDADLRRPQVHHKFGLYNRIGLTDLFLRQQVSYAGVVQPAATASRLGIITSGPLPANPAELLSSQKMMEIFESLNQEYDLIVIDTPPLLSVTDAAALAPAVDGVILVAKPGTTKMGAFQQSFEQLQAVGAHILGVVLNGVNPKSRQYGYYYNRYYSKYAHYYEKPGNRPTTNQQSPTLPRHDIVQDLKAKSGKLLPSLKIKK